MLEIISPAGNQDAVIAAVQNGADAIYFRLHPDSEKTKPGFLSHEEFEYASRYCRVRGCKLYLAMDSLYSDRELSAVLGICLKAARLGIDAIMVRDLGLCSLLRQALPGMQIFAAPGLGVHNLAGVEAAAELGMSRVFLARELTAEQIGHISRRTGVELSVFAHGEMCFSHTGQCHMSALAGKSSANRGLCDRPCRERCTMGGRMDEYPLSLKDNCLAEHLVEIDKLGVGSIIIEGLGKRPEYTALVTGLYHEALVSEKKPPKAELRRLEEIFSPHGSTDRHFTGDRDIDPFTQPSNAEKPSSRVFSQTRRAYSNSELRRVPVTFYAVLREGEHAMFAVQDELGNKAVFKTAPPTREPRQEFSPHAVAEELHKTGGTPYSCKELISYIDPGLSIPGITPAELRNELLAQLSDERLKLPNVKTGTTPPSPGTSGSKGIPLVNFQISSANQLTPELAEQRPHILYAPLELIVESPESLRPFVMAGSRIGAVLPRVFMGAESGEIRAQLKDVRALGVEDLLVGNLGHIRHGALEGFRLRGDFGLGVFNSHTLELLRKAGFLSATASYELKLAYIKDMQKPIDMEAIVYGRLPLMISQHCIMKRSAGRCTCKTLQQLRDSSGALYPVMREFGCRNAVLNSKKLFLADRRREYESVGLWAARLLFTTESSRECVAVSKAYAGQSDYMPNGVTRALYYNGVE